MSPHFKWFYLPVVGTRETYFKEKQRCIVEVVVTYNDVKLHLGPDTECKVQFAYIFFCKIERFKITLLNDYSPEKQADSSFQ